MALYIHVVLNVPPQLLKLSPFAKNVYGCMNGNPRFPFPDPPLANLQDRISIFDKALASGTRAEKLAAREGLKEALHHERNYVQKVAESASGTADLAAIQVLVESGGMFLRKIAAHDKYAFAAKNGEALGSVVLTAPTSRKRDPHEWQVSVDQVTWVTLPSTRQARTEVTGLPSGVAHYFRHRLLTKDGYTEWCEPIVIVPR